MSIPGINLSAWDISVWIAEIPGLMRWYSTGRLHFGMNGRKLKSRIQDPESRIRKKNGRRGGSHDRSDSDFWKEYLTVHLRGS